MLLIGENINVMNRNLLAAMKERRPEPIQALARESERSGVDVLDLNIGPARRDGPELMRWMIRTVREVSTLPLSLDTTSVDAIRAGLELEGEKAIINSVQAKEERMNALLPLAGEYGCSFIALLVGPEGMPRDENERGALAAEFAAKVEEHGIDPGRVYFDPIVLPVRFQQEQVASLMEFMKMFGDLFPGFRTTCGLSNVSNGVPEKLRPIINRACLAMLEHYGMSSAIVDAQDRELIGLARGENEGARQAVHRALEDETLDPERMEGEARDYVKTVRVLQGKSIFSESWLKL